MTELVHDMTLSTLYCWRDVIIDATIVQVLRQHQSNHFNDHGFGMSPISLPAEKIKRFVKDIIIDRLHVCLADSSYITARVCALQENGVLTCASGMYHFSMWGPVSSTGESDHDTSYGSDLRTFLDSNISFDCRKKIICYRKLSLPFTTTRCLRLVLSNADTILNERIDGGGKKNPSNIDSNLSRSYCRFLAESLGHPVLQTYVELFHEVVIRCSVDPLTETGLTDYLSDCTHSLILSPPRRICDSNDNMSSPLTNTTDESVDHSAIGDDSSYFLNMWSRKFYVDKEKLKQLKEIIPSFLVLPEGFVDSLLLETTDCPAKSNIDASNFSCGRPPPLSPPRQSSRYFISLETRIIEFYKTYAPSKVPNIPEILQKYRLREDKLVHHMHLKYSCRKRDLNRCYDRFTTVTFADFFSAILQSIDEATLHQGSTDTFNPVDSACCAISALDDVFLEDVVRNYIQIVLYYLHKWNVLKQESTYKPLDNGILDRMVEYYMLLYFKGSAISFTAA